MIIFNQSKIHISVGIHQTINVEIKLFLKGLVFRLFND